MRSRPTGFLIHCVLCLTGSVLAAQSGTTDIAHAAAYSAAHAGDAVLVYQHESLIFEQYQNGWKADQPHQLASGTKSLSCVLVALGGPQISQIAQIGPGFSPVTVRQLLDLTSGISVNDNGELIQVSPPGQRFAYGGVSFAVYAQLLARSLPDGDVSGYLKRKVLEPLGITSFTMQPGNLASGAAMTARDWGKFGLVFLDEGQLIFPGPGGPGSAVFGECGKGSDANPYYGMGLWLNPAQPTRPAPPGVQRADSTDRIISAPDLPHDLMMAAGSGGQRLYILPTQRLVVVRFGHNTGPDYRDDVFLRLLLNIPASSQNGSAQRHKAH